MIIRDTFTVPGYDCREHCIHTKKGDHGIHNDVWIYVVKDMDLRCALELCVGSGIFPESVTWGLRAHEFVDAHFVAADGRQQKDPFWKALEAVLVEEATRCKQGRVEDGDLRWKVCDCCKGAQVLPV